MKLLSKMLKLEGLIESVCMCGCVYVCAHLFFILKIEAYGKMVSLYAE